MLTTGSTRSKIPVLDGKTEQTFAAHDISVSRQQDVTLLLNTK